MGNYYVNFTVRNSTQELIATALSGRSCMLSPTHKNAIVFVEATSEESSSLELGATVSATLSDYVLAAIDYDDDFLVYKLYLRGELIDEYNSWPGYFEDDEEATPVGGDAKKLCEAFDIDAFEIVERILRDDEYVFAFERHRDLMGALGLPRFAAGFGYDYAKKMDLPKGLSADELLVLD